MMGCIVGLIHRIYTLLLWMTSILITGFFFFFQAEDGIRDLVRSRGLGDVYKRQDTAGTFVSTSDDGIFRYDKNQNQWVLSNFGLTSLDIRSLASDNFGNIFAGGDNGTVYRRNYSGNWESIFSADSVENISVLHLSLIHISEPTRPY